MPRFSNNIADEEQWIIRVNSDVAAEGDSIARPKRSRKESTAVPYAVKQVQSVGSLSLP
jgi:hypothetical protein